jgi:hypothetical protein
MAGAFSIECLYCDAGPEIDSRDAAEAAGWIDIEADPDGLAWNHLGVCPDCSERLDTLAGS